MKEKDCPLTPTLNLLSKKWMLPILHQLSLSTYKRFGELEDNLKGISSRILVQRLKELQEFGIVKRISYHETPPRVEYSLTKKGEELYACFKSLGEWTMKWNTK